MAALRDVDLRALSNRLIGRDAERSMLRAFLDNALARMITVVGPPGVGKTRFAEQVSADLQRTSGRAWFVPLATVVDRPDLEAAIAKAVGARRPTATVQRIGGEPATLILDPFDHLLPRVDLLADLLDACPKLRIIVTSRSVLNVRWEHVLPVRPLVVPPEDLSRDTEGAIDVGEAAAYPAVRLFVDRATAARSDFALDAENVEIVAAMCRLLDGIPLAIEIAALRCRVVPPQVLLKHLNDSDSPLDLLVRQSTDDPSYHHSVIDAIGWSYGRLSSDEQQVFRSFGVFDGPASIDALSAVAASIGFAGSSSAVVETVGSLIDKSLVCPVDLRATDSRFAIYRTHRQYAARLLAERDERRRAREAHAAWFVSQARTTWPAFNRGQRERMLNEVQRDWNNLHSTLTWCVEHHPVGGLQLTAALWRYWCSRGQLTFGRRWVSTFLRAAPAEGDPDAYTEALYGAGVLARVQGDYDCASTFLAESINRYRDAGDRTGEAYALLNLGMVAQSQGSGVMRDSFAQSAAILRQTGDHYGLAFTLNVLGSAALFEHDGAGARRALTESFTLFEEIGDLWGVGMVLRSLGALEYWEGNRTKARLRLTDSVRLLRRADSDIALIGSLRLLGTVLDSNGETQRSVQLLSESDQLQRRLGMASRSPAAFQALGVFTERVVSEAIQSSPPRLIASPLSPPITPLSVRETEVLQLLGAGLTNAEIADTLCISFNTVKRHLGNIYSKLNVGNRVEAAAHAFANVSREPGFRRQ